MGMTETGGVITLTETDLDPFVTHAETRRLLTGPGLPSDSALLGFGALRGRSGLRRIAELVDDAEKLAEELRDQLVIGALRSFDRDLESLVLNGATGEVFTTYVHPRHPGLMDLSPLAPSLGALLRFAAATDELTASRGRFAHPAYGPKAVTAASELLASVFAADAGEDLAPYWRMAALIRPLARIARPGAGLALDLPPRLLDEAFGSAAIVRFEDVDFPGTLTHGPTRRFLSEVGLPENGYWYELDTDVPLPTLTEYYADEDVFTADELPEGADRLIRLGHLLEDTSLVVDGATGAILCWSEPDAILRPLNADISTLAFTVWLVHREKSLDQEHDLTDVYEQLAATMAETLAMVDPIACDPTPRTGQDDGWRYWPEAFEDQAGGGLYA
ncbi:SUKH-4 family immunity protein [Streptomyces yaanensis]|uniref:SUKH-4 family immunity protein n=1 Tax=Streptomyces yaanensis TaxID=1142239 RepID=A0ABV7SP42_9ACTN|nr:SUKH-4 family immunity protein [Streptomyces sp. CGMCC 4.7035]WNC03285.1 SUKH-4 family immunity protein [Streptomyces sp. CGMCC 4.7035]